MPYKGQMRIVVTGGSGFIGTCLVHDLIENCHEVVIFDKRKSEVYPDLCIVGDVRDQSALAQALRGVDAVYHLAAEHRDDVQPASLYYDVNVGGAKNLVIAAKVNNIKRIIFTSTVAIYGLDVGIPDESFPSHPFNDYGQSKFQSEVLFSDWAKSNSQNNLIIVRPVVTFGENNRGNVFNLVSQLASGRFVMIGRGQNIKSMAYVRNVSSFLVHLLRSFEGIKIYNYADKPDLATHELVATIYKALGKTGICIRIPYYLGLLGGYFFDLLSTLNHKRYPISSVRVRKFCANTQVDCKGLKETNFQASFSLKDGLEKMIKYEFLAVDK
jgi:nucleoside-diphosphate-sugar epimerase